MKKIALAALIATTFISTSVLAVNNTSTVDNVSSSPFAGPYIGAYGGYNWSELDATVAEMEPNGWDGGVFFGVQVDRILDRVNGLGIGLNGAIEGFYGISSADEGSIVKNDDWGISFRPGLSILTDKTSDIGINPYGIVGYRNSEYEIASNEENYSGFELGAGTELLAYGDIGIRAEYSHTWYGSQNGVDVDADDVRIGAAYHF